MTELTPRIGLVVLARPQFDTVFAEEIVAKAWQGLQALQAEIVGKPDLLFDAEAVKARLAALTRQPLDLVLVLQATFTDATMTVALAEAIDAPLFLWSFPEPRTGGRLRLNAICGVNLAAHALGRAGRSYGFVNAAADDPSAVAEIAAAAKAGAVRRKLKETRIGVVGLHPAGFDSCRYDGEDLMARFGVRVEPLELSAFLDRARAVGDDEVVKVRERVAAELEGLDAVDPQALAKSLRVYATLRRTADEGRFTGMAVRCWPEFFTELGGAACGPMGMMGEDGTPCGCEADVLGTISTLILRWLSGAPAFNSDLVDVDVADDTAVFWHCGQAPVSMADPDGPKRATLHSNRKLPLLYDFALKPGRVTLARLSQSRNEVRLTIGGGEVLKRPNSFSGTSGVVRFDRPVAEVMDVILGQGLEHHISLAYGDHRPALRRLAQMLDTPILDLTGGT